MTLVADVSDRWDLAPGDAITAELTATRRLGGGSAYEAWLAFDEITYGPVVVKLVRPDQTTSRSTLRGLRREVEALNALAHPALVRPLRAETDGERPHVVLESLDGARLSTLIRRYGPLQPQQYLATAIEVASALHYMHRLDWVHLDVKPSNIVMGAPATLIDLSVARSHRAAAELSHMVGTDAYAAPEQCLPGVAWTPGPASDVWGLAATLVHAISGERPFPDGDDEHPDPQVQYPQLWEEPVIPHRLVPAVLADLLAAMLDPEPGNRPLAKEVADALMPMLDGLPISTLGGFRVR